ncbi:ABC-type multidrug transport system, ATPase and permease component [Quadrisphaera granulorum]|uniref:ABC-type multidrug transport system fused ATPase/permease subunit n=1 Tax=Quadrisphaera granulorum TaxID=317664 RepID=A0A316AD78_9ACTN|nr:ABC transporter ATP-binding protein [Quadrisphaera granulorum]PWJ55198.1 ABC-type multidrug transport system fused ATPase/permease subunit [Quadrisphaera granulorum]SZE95707.1 ABC-type multidrug transport system, ATPase and permease component [Quadrisphaera granulorum]
MRQPAPLTWRRLSGWGSTVALALAVVAAVAETLATVVAGSLANGPTPGAVALLAALLIGSAVLDMVGCTGFSTVVGRAEGQLRSDLLDAALRQPLPVLEGQGVGELLDRVDDDTRQLAQLVRQMGWQLGRALLRSVLAWVVAGLTFWPAWFAFPLVAAVAYLWVHKLTPVVAARKTEEELAWSESATQLEESVAGRDDVRTSLGQAHVLAQFSARSAEVLRRCARTCRAATTVGLRTGLVLHALLAALALAGVWLVTGGQLGLPLLITLWLLVTTFVGRLNEVAQHLPDVQEGLGALTRIRSLMAAPTEPSDGAPVPEASGDPVRDGVEVRGLRFTYGEGFTLAIDSLVVPAGTSFAVVGRSGAGKSTFAKLLSRAVEPPPGTVLVSGQDVAATELGSLRRAVGVVTQRTELLSATLADNITLFAPVPRERVEAAVAELGIAEWVASLPSGLDTRLGASGVTLSAGEEQLVAFARLLVRDVRVVVLDEATARMDPQTEQLVTRASQRLLAGRTGVVIAHRLSTTRWCDAVAVLDSGRLVQHGPRAALATTLGPFRDLLVASGVDRPSSAAGAALVTRRERRDPRPAPPAPRPNLARSVAKLLVVHPQWGLLGTVAFLAVTLLGAYGALTGWAWGRLVVSLETGDRPWGLAVLVAACLLLTPLGLALAFRVYPMWWSAATLRLRLAVLRGQTEQRRLHRTPPGEVAARALDSDRLVIYCDRWVDVFIGALAVLATGLFNGSALAALVTGGVLALSALTAAAGAPAAGRAGRVAGDERARFGKELVSALDAVRTVKLAAAVDAVQRHLHEVDARRVEASVREQRVRVVLEGIPGVLVQVGVVAAWVLFLQGAWGLGTALAVATAVSGFGWFGIVAGAAVVEMPIARTWLRAASELAGRDDLVDLPPSVDLVAGTAPAPEPAGRVPLRRLVLDGVTAVHDDGTIGVRDVTLSVEAGSLVLLVGRVGSGKSSLLSSLVGLVDHEGAIRWNDIEVSDPQLFLRPGQVAHVAQVPRVLSGTFTDNVALGHERGSVVLGGALRDARLDRDVREAGGTGALVGHRGVRLSGGQVQRLALARALATQAELVVADDVSSALDAATELELWSALRERGATVVGCSAKRSALALADVVVVLDDGQVAATGPWAELSQEWGHLAG